MKTSFALVVLLLFASGTSFSQSSKVKTTSRKSWITDISFDPKAVPPPGQESGYYYLLIDDQENVIQQENYLHYAYKILTTEGIQEMADISVEFDPSYSALFFHAIVIHRNGKTIHQLPKYINTIQREQSMDRFLYDGSLTAVINLTDVRVGDIVEYSFTRKGYNPIYKEHFSKKIYFDYGIGFEKTFRKLVVPASADFQLKTVNTDLKPVVEKSGSQVSYTWSVDRTSGVSIDNHVPNWYDPYKQVIITDLKNWNDVAAWAAGLFEVSEAERERINQTVASAFEPGAGEAFALQAIRFVQDEVRYLGFESGLNSHKPHAPEKVYEQRFGDCKDKSLLLSTLLNARGIESHPVLISTVWRNKIDEQLPSLQAFNHCVVQVKLNGNTLYIDPTINNQGGKLENYYFPDYGKGLVVNNATAGFETFPPVVSSTITEDQQFNVSHMGGEATLTVRTTYTGVEADIQRTEFSKKNIETIQKDYITFYGNLYPDITNVDTITTLDNRRESIFTVEEKYKIPTFWKANDPDDGIVICEVYPQSLENYLNISIPSQRTAPYRLTYPLDYYHTIRIKVPEEWSLTPQDESMDTPYYLYEYQVSYKDREITIFTHYQAKGSSVPPEQFAKLVEDHKKMISNLGYSLTYNKNAAEAGSKKWPGGIVTLLSLGLGAFLMFRLYHHDPVPYFSSSAAEPIGGWLFLVALGISLSPLRMLFDFLKSPEIISSKTWLPVLTARQYGLFAFLLFEHIYNLVYFLFSILIVVLFYQRRSSLPRLITIFYGTGSIVGIADAVVAAMIDPASSGGSNFYRDAIQGVIAAAIWIPYFNISSRVRETFVNRLNDDGDNNDMVAQPVRIE